MAAWQGRMHGRRCRLGHLGPATEETESLTYKDGAGPTVLHAWHHMPYSSSAVAGDNPSLICQGSGPQGYLMH